MYPLTTISTVLLLVVRATAQATADPVSSFLSEAYSVYTEVTSILASDASNTASSTSSSTTSSSLSSAATTSSPSTSATSTSLTPTSSRTSATVAAASHSAAAHSGGGLSGTDLAIILGCVLGALALGLLLLVLVLCFRRRRHARNGSPRLLSPDAEEFEGWRRSKSRPGSRGSLIGANDRLNDRNDNTEMPTMAEHPAYANDSNHQNPFVPVPPAPRRSTQAPRADYTDGTVPGQPTFTEKSGSIGNDRHHADELAVGAGGAALGAAALHHHDKDKFDSDHNGNKYDNTYDEKPASAQRQLPVNLYHMVTTDRDSRSSGEISRPYNGDDYGYGTGPYEAGQRGMRQPDTSVSLTASNRAGYHQGPNGGNNHSLMAAGAGTLGGAALASHHDRNRSGSVPRRSYDSTKTLGPNSILEHNRHPMPQPMSDQELTSPVSSDSFSSATGIQGQNAQPQHTLPGSTATTNSHHIPSEMPGDMPTPPASASPHLSQQERPRSYSGGGAPGSAALALRRNQTPPNLPGRSPKRTRFSDEVGEPVPRPTEAQAAASDDSTWRLSSGMPGGWARNPASAHHHRRESSSFAANSDHLRNAGINPLGRAESPGRRSMPAAPPGPATGRRLRLADLQREEAERIEMERKGRSSMGTSTDSGEDGVSSLGYGGGHHGVGQAM